MRKYTASLILGIALASPVYAASAEEPLILSGEQMDQVTAGQQQTGVLSFLEVTKPGGIFDQLRDGTYIQNFFGPTGSQNPFGAFSQSITEVRERISNRFINVSF